MSDINIDAVEYQIQQFGAQYQTAINTLQSFIDETAWTNAKIINAIVFQSKVLLAILRYINNRLM